MRARRPGLSMTLQIVQVASMLLAESDGLLTELPYLVRESIRTREDTDQPAPPVTRTSPHLGAPPKPEAPCEHGGAWI